MNANANAATGTAEILGNQSVMNEECSTVVLEQTNPQPPTTVQPSPGIQGISVRVPAPTGSSGTSEVKIPDVNFAGGKLELVIQIRQTGQSIPEVVSTPGQTPTKRKYTRRIQTGESSTTKPKSGRGRPKSVEKLVRVLLVDGKLLTRGRPPQGSSVSVVYIPKGQTYNPKVHGPGVRFNRHFHKPWKSRPLDQAA